MGGPRYRRCRRAAFQVVDGVAVVVVTHRRTVHRLNETATEIWALLGEEPPFDEIVRRLGEAFDADEKTLRADLREVLDAMLAEGMIEPAGG